MLILEELYRKIPVLQNCRRPEPVMIDWQHLEEKFGLKFPGDFMEISEKLHDFEMDDFSFVKPSPGLEAAYIEDVQRLLGIVRSWAKNGISHSYVPHPGEPGLFPWGTTSVGDLFFWRVEGVDPEKWPVIVVTDNDYWTTFDGGVVKFLLAIMERGPENWGLWEGFPRQEMFQVFD
ncbi:hypothetical protein [Streptomyces sp. YIM 98790]|uniref:hypothetical protein n=1 Tax=Streptomyces sp. YIM 98790 TaxID=2689077 RepID=UPI00140D41E9|nr:hypothetical protein [Streptomyces sp. YIM 98790]